jgi:hypothetical protein
MLNTVVVRTTAAAPITAAVRAHIMAEGITQILTVVTMREKQTHITRMVITRIQIPLTATDSINPNPTSGSRDDASEPLYKHQKRPTPLVWSFSKSLRARHLSLTRFII